MDIDQYGLNKNSTLLGIAEEPDVVREVMVEAAAMEKLVEGPK